ncbi:hypothetical protein KBB96_12495 [Luteolibacter ambystomatis]|uniref:Uncharacterized protein n=1 Tax=Luteolibacter ambystomatis TaxID=2824561 RepID=A0A975G6J4_9BACT|nr:hypothetical protein [Luteolibacter ambystomatis]QUE49691.1 hypothetical protein KBB96_12495 [Luteolibacter ambystomatis]
MRLQALLLALTALASAEPADVTAVDPAVRERLVLSPFYQRQMLVEGFPIVSSDKVADDALREAAWIIRRVLDGRKDILEAMTKAKVHLTVMAATEFTTDVPEHSKLTPKAYWDRRARGLGATPENPCVSCAEENLIEFKDDPYSSENIMIHEFAHAIHETGMKAVDPTFDKRLKASYDAAVAAGLWKGKYAGSNRQEYWAEATQSWFDDNRENDNEHNHVNTRVELKEYDPKVAALCAEVYGDKPWRYLRPSKRAPEDRAHLKGVPEGHVREFHWPPQQADQKEQPKK